MKRFLLLALLSALGSMGLVVAGRPAAADEKQSAWGTIKGQVVWGGEGGPEPKEVNVNRDAQHCLSKGPILSEELVVNPTNKGVRWAVVWLEPEAGDPPWPIHPVL